MTCHYGTEDQRHGQDRGDGHDQYVSSIELTWGGRCAGSVAIAHALASQLRDGWRPYGRDKSIP
jgi:hypothetical protein